MKGFALIFGGVIKEETGLSGFKLQVCSRYMMLYMRWSDSE
jgi:hypothetical protein